MPRSITISEPRINDRIRVSEVRLIGPGGEQVGVVATAVALKLAQDADLDLVEVAPDARPPVAKLMDYGKFKYESDMKAREARRNQANTVLKEIRFRLKIDPHDYETKKGHVVRFLEGGDKVKVMIMFRGREQSRPEMGVRLLTRLAEEVADLGSVESMPKQDGRNMTMVLGPVKKKADAKAEQRKRADEINSQRMTKTEARRAAAEPLAPAEVDAPVEIDEVEVEEVSVPFEDVVAAATEAVAAAPVAPVEPVAPAEPVAPRSPAPRAAAARPAAAAARPAAARPAAARPAAAKPATARPATPAAPRPAAPKPAAATPAATPRPAAPKPAAPKPAPKPSPRKPS
ncbi:translation initiation factor IF-3 [Xylanimonas protaetiae]|uniref:Translation initiation factor IF-3 n=1 Tax=Xylanimonas protaetiae TaxID=2509457 RepID=A0A4V0YGB8_9MICO|nr:translation initiation factor IF-3 [Xylanimonas protaetiae]